MRELVTSSNKKQTLPPILPNMGIHTLVVDATFLMKRSFIATENSPEYHNKKGHYGGLYQFMMTLRMLVRNLGVNKVILMWDGENGGKMRHDIYQEYKANRENKSWHGKTSLSDDQIREQERSKRTLLAQRMRVKAYCEELFIRQVEVPEIEGDDLIAGYCLRYHDEEKITIYTNDNDFLQLLELDNVNVYLARKNMVFNKTNFFLHFDFHFSNACLMKIMCGDTSDNISGIERLGEDTLLNHFPDLKNRPYSYHELILESEQINNRRQAGKGKDKKPRLKVLDAITNGTTLRWVRGEKQPVSEGLAFYELNEQLVNLKEPMLNQEAIDELIANSELPLSAEDRGSKNLLRLMNDDLFLTTFGDNYQKYVEVFYPVTLREKKFSESA